MNYPKVCFGCSRPHIEKEADEMLVEGGAKVFHKQCAPTQEIEIVKEEGKKVEEKVQEVVSEGREKLVSIWDHIFGANIKQVENRQEENLQKGEVA